MGRRTEKMHRICPLYHRAIELVGKRWTGALIRALLDGPRRFSDLLGVVPGLHDRLLSERLKELEAEGIVARRVYPETPVRVEYELTEKGRDLKRVVDEVQRWANRWLGGRRQATRA
ncbi:MAG: helix-turn-helix domain-containing protein [Armatimonadota bacterium]|nr:helix-turn-helix domain-containing protein [Armatimonadota bacterium]